MTYSITSVQFSQGTGAVVSADWAYTTDKGALSSSHVFHRPAGALPAEQITDAVLIGWLQQQLPQSEEDMTASIAEEHDRSAEQATALTFSLAPDQTVKEAADVRRLQIEAEQEAERQRQAEQEALQQQIAAAQPWDSAATYAMGDVVTHNGKAWRKSDESENTEPSDSQSGWQWVG
jgi:hypothetical protein